MASDTPLFEATWHALHTPAPGGAHRWRDEPTTEEIDVGLLTPTAPGRYGWLPTPVGQDRVRLSPALAATAPVVPADVDYRSRVTAWPMLVNDQLGCCTASAAGHTTEAWTTYGNGAAFTPTDGDTVTFYSGSTGYKPGQPATDQGGVMADVLNYWRKTGWPGGHKIAGFGQLNPSDLVELKSALYMFGTVYLGVNLPNSALTQMDKGQPWTVVARDGGTAGGHCINLQRVRPDGWCEVITWGRVQLVDPKWIKRYCEEAWAPVSAEFVCPNGVAPNGLNTDALNAEFTRATGQSGPLPSPGTGPAPQPAPTPAPAVDLRALLRDIAADLVAIGKKIAAALGTG